MAPRSSSTYFTHFGILPKSERSISERYDKCVDKSCNNKQIQQMMIDETEKGYNCLNFWV